MYYQDTNAVEMVCVKCVFQTVLTMSFPFVVETDDNTVFQR